MNESGKAIGLVCCAILFIATCIVVPITMIVIGDVYIDDCPVEHNIPIWLIVSGVVALFQGLFAPAFRNDGKSERTPGRGIFQAVGLIINIFQMVWFIIGSVWVYGNYEPSYNEADDHMFCDETVYLFSFWILNVTYIGLCVALLISIAVFVYNRGLSSY